MQICLFFLLLASEQQLETQLNLKIVVDGLFSLTMDRGVGLGGADFSQLQDCGIVACGEGDEFLARAGARVWQDGCFLVVVY